MSLDSELDAAWAELTGRGAPFELETIVVSGLPLRAYRKGPRTVRDVWMASKAFGSRDYLVYEGERLAYDEAHVMSAAVANWLLSQGVHSGDRVAIAMRNYPEWLIIYWGALSIGVAVIGFNAWWTAAELAHGLADSKPKILFADGERLLRLEGAGSETTIVAVRARPPQGGVPWSAVMEQGGAMPEMDIEPDSDACVFYTSGTTGSPKGALQTHRAIVTNLLNMQFCARVEGLALQRARGLTSGGSPTMRAPTNLVAVPLFHVTGCNCAAFATTSAGGTILLMRRWDAASALELIEREGATTITAVPTMIRELMNHPDFAIRNTSTLQSLGGGGAAVSPDLVGRIVEEGGNAVPRTGYGMTETSGIVTTISGDFLIDRPASCGRAMPTYEIRVTSDDGTVLASGETGELEVRGAAVIKGYLNCPEATAEAIRDGWLRTGDVARVDEAGFIFLVDRKKGMVLRGGENVYSAEVEAALYRHEGVSECSVFGIPDERLGEEVAAVIALRSGCDVSAEDLRSHCAALIARHKMPRYIWIVDYELPKNATGKILKQQLRDTIRITDAS